MKKCCPDYDTEFEIKDGITVHDFQKNHDAQSKTIKDYILSHELADVANLPSNQIMDRIQSKLLENGFIHDSFHLKNTTFYVYKFFFVPTDEEKNVFIERIRYHLR